MSLLISSSPHIHSKRDTRTIMLDVIIALIPALIAGSIIFGIRAFLLTAVCIVSSVLSEWIFNKIVKKEQTIGDLSAVVTGLLLGLNLSADIPYWQAVIGSVFAIIIVKCIFGGIGCNLVNPAITARVFMLVAFGSMTKYAFPVDTVAGATPLSDIAAGNGYNLLDLVIGKRGGALGETCVIALVIGGIYLLVRKVITWHIPVSFILSTYVLTLLTNGFDFEKALALTLSGGLFIGAIFMATDYVTSPSTPKGKLIFGIGCGIITFLIRQYGSYPEGVSFAILLMNILNPYVISWSQKKHFGEGK